jgi:hypothetical protein
VRTAAGLSLLRGLYAIAKEIGMIVHLTTSDLQSELIGLGC